MAPKFLNKVSGQLQAVQNTAPALKRIAKYGGAALSAVGLSALALGKAVFTGFLVGAAAGGVAGAIIGAKIGAAVGFAVCGPVCAVGGGLIGGTGGFFVGAVAGGVTGGAAVYALERWGASVATNAKSALTSFGTAANSFLSGLWSGATSAVGSFFSGASSFFVSLTSLSLPTVSISIPFFATLGTIFAGGTIIGIVVNSTFFARTGDESGGEFRLPGENEFVSLTKTVLATEIPLGPLSSIRFANGQLPEPLQFDVKVKAKTALTNVTCTDILTLTKNGIPQNIPIPAPSCPSSMTAGQEYSFTFTTKAESPQFDDSLLLNTFTLNGTGQSIGNLNYYIPFRDTNVKVIDEANVKNRVATNPKWPNNFVNTECEPGVSCWDYVKRESIAGGVNPAFTLAVWIAESGASDSSGHLSCPNGGVGLSHTVSDLKLSVACFVDLANNFAADQFPQMIDQFCDPATPEICQVLPDPPKTFLNSLKDWYSNLVPPGFYGALTETSPSSTTTFSESVSATVVIGGSAGLCRIIEFKGPWSSAELFNINEICLILDSSPRIVSLLQNAGAIFLERVPNGSLGSGVCGTVTGKNFISIGCDMSEVTLAKYVIIHELGHVIANYNGSVYNSFLSVYAAEGLLPTYPFGGSWPSESFAEMIADYVVSKIYNFLPRSWSGYPGGVWNNPGPGWTTYENQYPQHYNFARTEIFGEAPVTTAVNFSCPVLGSGRNILPSYQFDNTNGHCGTLYRNTGHKCPTSNPATDPYGTESRQARSVDIETCINPRPTCQINTCTPIDNSVYQCGPLGKDIVLPRLDGTIVSWRYVGNSTLSSADCFNYEILDPGGIGGGCGMTHTFTTTFGGHTWTLRLVHLQTTSLTLNATYNSETIVAKSQPIQAHISIGKDLSDPSLTYDGGWIPPDRDLNICNSQTNLGY